MELSVIKSKIHEIRGIKVMLDVDLAVMYQVETGRLNEAVRRNIKRFPPDFMFQLTKNEFENLKSQIATSSWGGTRKLPFAFTELGATMISSVLRSDVAVEASILVVRAFVAVRNLVLNVPVDEVKELKNEVQVLKESIEGFFKDQNDINEDTRIQLELINQSLAELHVKHKGLITDDSRLRVGYTASRYLQEGKE